MEVRLRDEMHYLPIDAVRQTGPSWRTLSWDSSCIITRLFSLCCSDPAAQGQMYAATLSPMSSPISSITSSPLRYDPEGAEVIVWSTENGYRRALFPTMHAECVCFTTL